ncbi:hypothetical protein ACQ4PT_050652 [Festuca glaucescens]
MDAEGFNATLLCNNKLVGAKSFTGNLPVPEYDDPSPRDFMGHGSHVASTAAGAEVPWADMYGFSGGRASGVARNARIAMYKACVPRGCPGSAIIKAIDAAVSDGVDLISISIGGGPGKPFYDDPIAVATCGAGMVSSMGMERLHDAVNAPAFTLPGVMISDTAAKKLDAYMSSSPYPVASLAFACETVTGENRAPMVAGFSSRGPSVVAPEILKPDVVAPGVNILAAWSGAVPPSGSKKIDQRRVEYNIVSGTSMATPHVAGAAALIKKVHGDWTPAMVRSALMTSAGPLDKNGRGIVDGGTVTDATPLAAGAGLVLPRLAMDPGLVYDAGTPEYVGFLCTLNYTAEQMRQFVPEMSSAGSNGGACTLTRTVTKVSAQPETYSVTFAAPEDVKVTVTPETLEFKRENEKRSYTVEFSLQSQGKVRPAGTWDFGHISWENRKHRVRSPVAFKLEDLNTDTIMQ